MSQHRLGSHRQRPAVFEPLESRRLLAAAPVAFHANAGGGAVVDSIARPFDADGLDAPAAGGDGFVGGARSAATFDVSVDHGGGNLGPSPDAGLFATNRRGASFAFRRSVPNGRYTLLLGFAEPGESAVAGQRVFDVSAEGRVVVDDLDLARVAGPRVAAVRAAEVVVADGRLDLSFTAATGEAVVSYVALVPNDAPPAAWAYTDRRLADLAEQSGSNAAEVAAASRLRVIGQGMLLYANEHQSKFPDDLPSLVTNQSLFDLQLFVSPRSGNARPRGELSLVEASAWVASVDDVVYLGAGKKDTVGAGVILAYENPARVAGRINALFGDGHVEALDRADLASRGVVVAPAPAPRPASPVGRADPRALDGRRNLDTVGRATFLYSLEHSARYPATIGEIVSSGYAGVTAQAFVDPRDPSAPTPPPGLDDEAAGAWARANAGYVYLYRPRLSQAGAETVVMFEKPAGLAGGVNLLFADGRVEYREMRWAAESVRRSGGTFDPGPVDATPPTVVAGAFDRDAAALPLMFSEDVWQTLDPADVVVTNLATGVALPASAVALDAPPPAGRPGDPLAARVRFVARPADGNYRVTVRADTLYDAAGNRLAGDRTFDLFALAGDATGDRRVDSADFRVLLANFGRSGVGFGGGDFTGDGRVDGADLNVYLSRVGTTLPPPPARPAPVVSRPATAPTPDPLAPLPALRRPVRRAGRAVALRALAEAADPTA